MTLDITSRDKPHISEGQNPTPGPDNPNRRILGFVARFIGIFAGLILLYHVTRIYTTYVVVTCLTAAPASAIINTITPSEQTHVNGQTIEASGFRLTIARGCDGMEAILLLTAAFLSFPLPWRRRLIGVLIGMLALYALNLVRVVTLYYAARHQPALFDVLHLYVWQALMILAGLFLFAWWAGIIARPAEPKTHHERPA